MSKLTKWQIQAKILAELHNRVSRKGAIIVPKTPKEELQELIRQAQINADRTLSHRLPKIAKL